MDSFLRYFLPAFFVLYLGVAFVWRSWVVYRRTGINPLVFGTSDSPHDFVGRVFKLAIAMLLGVVVLYSFWPDGYSYLQPIPWMDRVWLQGLGIALMLISFGWTAIAQVHMGDAWRIGVDLERATELVDHGIFGLSRNPIFVGMRLTVFGFFLCAPNALTLALLFLSDVLIQVQVRLEEEHLASLHGDRYLEYRRRVRRWL